MGTYEEERVWERHWDKSVKNLLKQYSEAFNRVLRMLYDLTGEELSKLDKKREKEILLMIAANVAALQDYTEEWILAEITTAFAVGQASAMVAIGLAGSIKEGMENLPKSTYANRVLESVLQDTMEDLLYATEHTNKRTKRLIRDVFSQSLKQKAIENQGLRTVEKEIKEVLTKKFLEERLKKEGFVGIISKNGKKWQLNTYIEMAVRTKYQESFREGAVSTAIEKGHDIAYISDHNTDCEKCRKYEGLIISLTGKTPGYPKLDDIRASEKHELFHPRCKHKIRSVRKLELIPPNVREKNEKARTFVKDLL
jgi:hypothetical protein